MERRGEQSKFHYAPWLSVHGQIVLCIHRLMCGQKTFSVSLYTKMATWLGSGSLGLFVCSFVCLFRMQFKHLSTLIKHEDNTGNGGTTSGVSCIKRSSRGSRVKRCISGENGGVSVALAFTRANTATNWTRNYSKSIYGHLWYLMYAVSFL